MPPVHRDTDVRSCGALTISSQSKNVYVNGLLWAIEGDTETHGDGQLIASVKNIFIGGKRIIIKGDSAAPDDVCPVAGGAHCDPIAVGASPNVFVGG